MNLNSCRTTVWGHVKDYLELVDYLLGEDSNDEWNVIMAEMDVDNDTEYPTRCPARNLFHSET